MKKMEQCIVKVMVFLFVLAVTPGGWPVMAAEGTPTASERMWGDALPKITALLNQIDEEFSAVTIEDGFNGLYGRNQLDLKTRELCTITMLTCLGKPEELNLHLMAGLRVGWKVDDLREIMILSALPAGWPASIDALRFLGEWCEKNKVPMPPGKKLRPEFRSADWYKSGYEKGEKLYGKKLWGQYLRALATVDPELAKFTVANLYGKFLSRPTISDKTRELCFVAGTGAMMKSKQLLRMHIQGALNSGATPTEVKEALYHIGLYAGQGASAEAIAVYYAMGLK
jgi:4-carboxymuconolactone decarboxylase